MLIGAQEHSKPPRSPKAVLSTSREEFYLDPLELLVQTRITDQECSTCSPEDLLSGKAWKDSQLPDDLNGHVFIVGAVGYGSSQKHQDSEYIVEPASDGLNCIINGEGMIYRVDFHQTHKHTTPDSGKAWIATRIVKTPDYFADMALQQDGDNNKYKNQMNKEQYSLLQFNNFFITRLSIELGNRNLLNTAFLPMKYLNGNERLLVCWDNGRPYELDPQTLGLVGPIGWNKQWFPITGIAQKLLKHIFPIILSSAHPVFDTQTDEMFTINATKKISILLPLSRILTFDVREFAEKYITTPLMKYIFDKLVQGLIQLLQFPEGLLEIVLKFLNIENGNSIILSRWDGSKTCVEQWSVKDANGRAIKIQQSLHQMGLSKDYILFSDSAFKLPLEDFLAGFRPKNQLQLLGNFPNRLRSYQQYLSYPQLPYTDIYIIPRNQLVENPNNRSHDRIVKAIQATLIPETAHFLVEYDNPDDIITLHIAHTAASDPAEFLKINDSSIYDKNSEITNELRARAGMFVSPMDVNRLSVRMIDVRKLKERQGIIYDLIEVNPIDKLLVNTNFLGAEQDKNTKSIFLSDQDTRQFLWSISMCAWRGFQQRQFTDIYWNCWGLWQELLSDFIYEMYDNYPNNQRLIPVQEIRDSLGKTGRPANLIRTHIERQSSEIQFTVEDYYNFPDGSFGNSPQFVPRSGTVDPTDGYIVCVFLHSDNLLTNKSEIWIFDAKKLRLGPLYRLSHPKLNIGVTIHTTWLSKLETPPARTDYSVKADYQDFVKAKKSDIIDTLFEQDVYPHFEAKD